MTGSEFVRVYAKKGLIAWEAAALELARQGQLTPRAWVPITLTDGQHTATIQVQNDVLAIGPLEDSVRLPLRPGTAQSIFNLQGWLLPTPWLVYQMWRNAPIKLSPLSAGDLKETNLGANLEQYAKHSAAVDRQIAEVLTAAPFTRPESPELIAGQKKSIVVSNIYQPKKVLIFGWYRPPPSPDVFDDGQPMGTPGRQPIQPRSNVHGDFYVDYSHGAHAVHPMATVDGMRVPTVSLYQHPTLSKLVSNEGPVRVPRYPSPIAPPASEAIMASASLPPTRGFHIAPNTHGFADAYLSHVDAGAINRYPWNRRS